MAAITFLPLAVDTFGGWHKVGLKTITRLRMRRQLARNRQEQCGNDGKPTPNLCPPQKWTATQINLYFL